VIKNFKFWLIRQYYLNSKLRRHKIAMLPDLGKRPLGSIVYHANASWWYVGREWYVYLKEVTKNKNNVYKSTIPL